MPLPYEKPATLLQWLDNRGHYVLRFGRQTRRFFAQIPWLCLWLGRQLLFLATLAWHVLLTLLACFRRVRAQLGDRRAESTRPRLYLLDPSYQNSFGHYRSVAHHLAEDCARRGWNFIHLTGALDKHPAQRIPLFALPARLPLRLAEPFWSRNQHRKAHRKTAFALRYFTFMVKIVAAFDRLLLPGHPAHFVMYTGDLLYFIPLLNSPFLGPRQHLHLLQFYLPIHFAEPAEKRRFLSHARLLAQRFRSAAPDTILNLHLYSDSPLLHGLLAPLLGAKISVLYPPFLAAFNPEDLPAPESLAQRPHPFGYFGYLTEKHGWPIMRQLLQSRAGQSTGWLIQFIPAHCTAAEIAAARATITAAGATALTGYYPPNKFSAAVAQCAGIFLPYDTDDYAFLSSAKIIDALRQGCFPIVPAHTWPAEIVRRAGYGLIVEKGPWLDAPAAVAQLDLPALWSQRRSAILALIEQFTAAHFLSAIEQASPPAALPEN